MTFVKKIKNGKSTIEVSSSNLTKEEKKENLICLYQTIYKIVEQKQTQNTFDVWFYTKEELDVMKKSGNYDFL